MATKRPTRIMVFAILNIIFGVLGLFGVVAGAGLQLAMPALKQSLPKPPPGKDNPPDTMEIMEKVEQRVPSYKAVQWGLMGLGLVLSLILLVAGIRLLKMDPLGRWLSVAYSLLRILTELGGLVYTIAVINPVIEEIMETSPVKLPTWTFTGLSICGAFFGMAYAIVLGVFMILPGTGQALAGVGTEEAPGDYYDPGFERERREPTPEDRLRRPDEGWPEGQ
jgi:hypothetical protein